MNKFCPRFAWVALLFGCSAFTLAAQPATNATRRPQPDRWLLIVDTSAAMERRAKAVEGVFGELLASGMNGQMHTNDEIGIWTFNKELYAGVAPMQSWQPAKSNIIASRSAAFIGRQIYRGKSRLDVVFQELSRVVAESRGLTVVLFSDGATPMAGTPFDDAINLAYAQYKPELARTRMPLVTILRSHHGKYIGHSVSFAPWPVEFPPFPEAEKQPAVAPINAPATKPAAPAKSIIIKPGPKNEESVVALTPEPPTAVTPGAPPPIKASDPAPIVVPVEPPPVAKPAELVMPATDPVPKPKPVEVAQVEAPQTAIPPVAKPVAPPVAPEVVATAPAPAVAPAATGPGDVIARKLPLILGIAFMWAAIVVALVLARRNRRSNAASLITRSFDKRK